MGTGSQWKPNEVNWQTDLQRVPVEECWLMKWNLSGDLMLQGEPKGKFRLPHSLQATCFLELTHGETINLTLSYD